MQLVKDVPVQCVHRVHQLMGKGSCQQGVFWEPYLHLLKPEHLTQVGWEYRSYGVGGGVTINTQPLFLQEPQCWGDK